MPIKPFLICLSLLPLSYLCGMAQPNPPGPATHQSSAKPVMLMNRIGPSTSELYVANTDGTNEHKLLTTNEFNYHASYAADGKWIAFTSERGVAGQADIYRVHPDGTGLEQLTNSPAPDDQATLSPDGTQLAFISSRETRTANIRLLNLKTHKLRNLTGKPGITGDPGKPNSFRRPVWSPDGKWLAFASDQNTEWNGHGNGSGWEHVQEIIKKLQYNRSNSQP